MSDFALPQTPCSHEEFIPYITKNPTSSLTGLVSPFVEFEQKLREGFAQHRDHPAVQNPNVNAVPIYAGHEDSIRIRARSTEDETLNSKYIMPLKKEDRKRNGDYAIVPTFKQFKKNFDVFSESSLVDLDWSNVVVAGSAVVTSLVPVPEKHNESKRTLRNWYHQEFAPSSDVDLFLWGLNEEAAIKKILEIEARIKDTVLSEVTTIRTKNAITIVSQYPIRHVQIVLRLYKNVSEILTGFDVDSSCFAYDGKQVYGTPRGITAFMSQSNGIDLSRRSPSYETRLAKYAHRGFEIFCPILERDRIDPTVFERSFVRMQGLARLLVLERLPNLNDRESYLNRRREERGRPRLDDRNRNQRQIWGNLKDKDPEDVAEWDIERDISNYHTFTIPYGPKISVRKVERLLYTKDMLLNAEWNEKRDRDVDLHRHPCFIGDAENVIHDCCQNCPAPTNDEEREMAAEESKHYVSGELEFMKDDPGRQTIGSFHPLTNDDWLDMAYLGNVEELCQAIVDCNLEFVQQWCAKEDSNTNRRDHSGRTPLQLACQSSTVEIVKCLIDAGSRIVSRMADGFTALHIAAARGHAPIVAALLEKSEANEEAEEEKKSLAVKQKESTKAKKSSQSKGTSQDDGDDDESSEANSEDSDDYVMSDAKSDSLTQGSFVKVESEAHEEEDAMEANDQYGPDVYDVNVLAWDSPVSPLHLAILFGNIDTIKTLIDRFGADVLLPIKIGKLWRSSDKAAILTLVLAGMLTHPNDTNIAEILMDRGASTAQADTKQITALHFITAMRKVEMLKMFFEKDAPSAKAAVSHLVMQGYYIPQSQQRFSQTSSIQIFSPLLTAIKSRDYATIEALIDHGAEMEISLGEYSRTLSNKFEHAVKNVSSKEIERRWKEDVDQPIVVAIHCNLPDIARLMLDRGVPVNSLTRQGHRQLREKQTQSNNVGETLLDLIDKEVKKLKSGLNRQEKLTPPLRLQEDDTQYLEDSVPGTYRHQMLKGQVDLARRIVSRWHEVKNLRAKETEETLDTDQQKRLKDDIGNLEELRKYFVSKGAKTFEELHPSPKKDDEEDKKQQEKKKDQPFHRWNFAPDMDFNLAGLDDKKRAKYLDLFEAAWRGDVDAVKQLTLKQDGDEPPLQAGVTDKFGFSPFAIALARGHRDLALLILEIVNTQYEPYENSGQPRRRYLITDDEEMDVDDGGSDASDNELQLTSELVDETFTIDNIAELQKTVGSKFQVPSVILQSAPFWLLSDVSQVDEKIKVENLTTRRRDIFKESWRNTINHQTSVIDESIKQGDLDVLRRLIKVSEDSEPIYGRTKSTMQHIISFSDLKKILEGGNLQLAGEIIRLTGVGLPLEHMVDKEGVRKNNDSDGYQGLLIHGKRKKEWAAENGQYYANTNDDVNLPYRPLLLEVAHMGFLEPMEWVLSNTPRRMYYEYGSNNGEDQRIADLSDAEGGFNRAVDNWFDRRTKLAIHCAILATSEKDQRLKTLKYLVDTMPQYLEVKSNEGFTPLSLAFARMDVDAAEILINAGADQKARDKESRNLVHLALSGEMNRKLMSPPAQVIQRLLGLIDSRLLPELFMQRCSEGPTALTPLAWWIWQNFPLSDKEQPGSSISDIFKLLLGYLSGDELKTMDGSGQLIMHSLVKRGDRASYEILKTIFGKDPQLVQMENAVGQTALELAEVFYIRGRVDIFEREMAGGYSTVGSIFNGSSHYTDFIDEVTSEDDMRGSAGLIWKLCKDTAEQQTNQKRILVPLHQASEVTKRIASIMQRQTHYNRYRYNYNNRDEVHMWS